MKNCLPQPGETSNVADISLVNGHRDICFAIVHFPPFALVESHTLPLSPFVLNNMLFMWLAALVNVSFQVCGAIPLCHMPYFPPMPSPLPTYVHVHNTSLPPSHLFFLWEKNGESSNLRLRARRGRKE